MLLTRRAALKATAVTAVGALTGAGAYGMAYERHRIGVTEASLPVSGLPAALDGLRIGLLTDIHHSRMVPADDVSQAVSLAMAQRPDLIILGGDYVTFGDRAFVGPVADLLSSLDAPHGVFAILGNHDDDRDMPAALTARRIQVLKDARTRLEIRGEALELAGVRFWTRRPEDVARVLRQAGDTVLLLAHDPRRLTEAAALNVPAVLSAADQLSA
jgi:predicted MPP superfamily phosphohydrolase